MTKITKLEWAAKEEEALQKWLKLSKEQYEAGLELKAVRTARFEASFKER